ncbi:MAG: TIM barrel protein [Gammaproteobacteria bacterium]|nr:TIM barrel protein [Gammaproteobacteria bacterium]
MARISANLGFLWRDLDLPDAIRAAAAAGFDAVECHFPFHWPAARIGEALGDTGLPMVCLNASKGREGSDDFGLTAVPGRQREFRAALEQAVAFASAIGCPMVQAIAGRVSGAEAHGTAVENLAWACELAAQADIDIIIEPKNTRDVPGYFLTSVEQAAELGREVAANNLKLLFDCYHVQINQGDLIRRFERHQDFISHIQIAAVPSRGAPDEGEIAYQRLIAHYLDAGYRGSFGAEYVPGGDTSATLAWLPTFKRIGDPAD